MRISVIGTGIYGIAIASVCASNNHQVIMWTEQEKLALHFQKKHDLKPITNYKISDNINVTNNLEEALNSPDLIILATSAKYIRETCLNMEPLIDKKTPICLASKGIENNTCEFLSDIVKDILKTKHLAVISGPTFAIDLINHEPACLTLATKSKKTQEIV